MAHDRRPILTLMADKIAAREIVRNTIGSEFLSTIYHCSSDPTNIDWSALPREYVCKVNHISGGIIMVWDGAPANSMLPTEPSLADPRTQIRPEQVDVSIMTEILKYWLTLDYSWMPGRGAVEWAYQDINRAVLIEEFLRDESGGIPKDYKFFVFNGNVKLLQIDSDRFEGHRQDFVTPKWEVLPVHYNTKGSGAMPIPPRNLDTMLQAAERLGALSDFVRVDLYHLGDRVIFGEFTHYPNAAEVRFKPAIFDSELGQHWQINDY